MPIHGTSDSDDDLFFQAGRPRPVSVYAINSNPVASSDDDDDVQVVSPTPKRPRGRPGKPNDAHRTLPSRQKKSASTSVFQVSSSDDEPTVVNPAELDHTDGTVAASLAHARAVLADVNEEEIAREAEEEFRKERELVERQEAEQRQRAEAQRHQNTSVSKNHQNSPWATTSASRENGETAPLGRPIKLKVRLDDTRQNAMRIRVTDPLHKMLGPFCDKFGLRTGDVVMKVDGEVVGEKDTPESMDCDDNMQIDIAMRPSRRV